ILVDYLTISDTDGDTEFTLAVQLPDNPNYTSAGAVITPDPNFNGQLTIPIVVNDGTADSPVFNFVLEVTAANDLPVISGQVNPARQMNEDANLTLVLADVTFTDPDPSDTHTLLVEDGPNYTRSGNQI